VPPREIFVEGIRAAIIDKDRNPRWRHASMEDVTADEVGGDAVCQHRAAISTFSPALLPFGLLRSAGRTP
jgi:hypothetical protein